MNSCSDASFVDLIHCNGGNEDSGFLGINAAVGHADFFPNGGHHVGLPLVLFKSGKSYLIIIMKIQTFLLDISQMKRNPFITFLKALIDE